jgi:drug/metabolite transporter (DMT)-like permease
MERSAMSVEKLGGSWRMVLAMGLSGTIGLLVLLSGQSAATVVWFRCLIGSVALLGWLQWSGRAVPLNKKQTAWLLLGGGALVLNWLCLFSAFQYSSISIATVVYHVQPFFLIVLTAVVQKERLQWRKMPWLVLAFLGVALTTGMDWSAVEIVQIRGVLLALSAAFLYALATLATRKLPQVPPSQIAGLQLAAGAVILFPSIHFSFTALGPQTWVCLVTLGIVHTGVMYNLLYSAFQRLSASAIATLSFIYPLVALVVDQMFFHTTLSASQLAGIGMILLAMMANQRGWLVGKVER